MKERLAHFFNNRTNVLSLGAIIVILIAVPLTVYLSQQRQELRQRASEVGTACPERCSTVYGCTQTGVYRTATNNCDQPIAGSQSYHQVPTNVCGEINVDVARERGSADANNANCPTASIANPTPFWFCTYDTFQGTPDWAKGNDGLGNSYYCGPPESGQTRPAGCGVETRAVWVAGDLMPPSSNVYGAKLPVTYTPKDDLLRFEFSGRQFAESSWSRFVRRLDDSNFGEYSPQVPTQQIATGVIEEYDIIRIARDGFQALKNNFEGDSVTQAQKDIEAFMSNPNGEDKEPKFFVRSDVGNHLADGTEVRNKQITLELISKVIGFDVRHLRLERWGGLNASGEWDQTSQEKRRQNMIEDTSKCAAPAPAPAPTSSTPISCTEHLLVPPVGFTTDFPAYTKNLCNTLEEGTVRNELTVCGDYWISTYCNAAAAGDDSHRNNAMFACRGWSQISPKTTKDANGNYIAVIDNDRLLLYYTNRLRTVSGQITDATTYEQRKTIWNNFMREVKQKSIAFPYEHSSNSNPPKTPEMVRDNALNAAASAIFGKGWGFIKDQERMNNCSTTWDGPTGGTPNTGTTCHRCSNAPEHAGEYATFQTNDACPNGVSATAVPIPNTATYAPKAECTTGTTPGTDAPTVTFSADKTTATVGDAIKLTWTATGATSCTASGDWTGAKTATGGNENVTVATAKTYTYTLACTNAGGTTTKTVTVPVIAVVVNPPPTTGTRLSFNLVLHGRGAGGDNRSATPLNPNPKPNGPNNTVIHAATVIISDVNDTPASRKQKQTTLTMSATDKKFKAVVDVSDLIATAGNYTITIKPQFYLAQTPSNGAVAITINQENQVAEMQVIGGDADNSNELNLEDYNMIRGCLPTGASATVPATCNDTQKTATDFNGDGKVDETDRNFWVRELAAQKGR